MKTTQPTTGTLCIILAILLCASPGTSRANLSGSDNFNDNSKDLTKWGTDVVGDPTSTAGTLTETNFRLEYTATGASAKEGLARPWIANTGSYTSNWSVQIDVNVPNLTLGAGQRIQFGLGVQNAADPTDGMSLDLRLDPTQGRFFRSNLTTNGVDQASGPVGSTTALTLATIRIRYVAASTTLFEDFAVVGSNSFTNFDSRDVAAAGWGMNGSSVFDVAAFGASRGSLVVSSSDNLNGDNFVATPEPTTLALAAIGALALLGRASRRRGQTTVKTTHRVSLGLVALSIAFPFTAKSDNAQFTAGYGNFSVNHSSGFGTTGSNSVNNLYVQSPGYSSLFTYDQVLSEPGGPGISSGHAGLGLAMFSDLAAVVMSNGTGVSQSDVAGSSPGPAQLTIQYIFQPNLQSGTPWNGIVSMHYVLNATVGPSIGDYDRFDALADFSDGLGGPTTHLELHRLFDVPGSSFSGVDLYAEAPFSIAPSAIEIIYMTGTTTFTVLDPGGGGSITGQTIVPEVSTYTMLVIGIGLMAGAIRFRRGSRAA